MNKWTRAVNSGIMSLFTPKKLFEEDKYHQSSIFGSLLIIIVLVIVSQFLYLSFMQRDGIKDFMQIIQKQAMVESGMTEEQTEEFLSDDSMSSITTISQTITAGFGSIITMMIRISLYWVFLIFIGRMLGAEESSINVSKKGATFVRKNKGSLFIAIYTTIPIVLSMIVGYVLILTKPDSAFVNILSMADFTEQISAEPTLYYLFFDADLPIIVERVLHTLTNPFVWWFYIIAFAGNSVVLKMKTKQNIILIAIWFVITVIFGWATLAIPKQLGLI